MKCLRFFPLLLLLLSCALSQSALAAPLFDDTFLAIELQNDVYRPNSAKAADVAYKFGLKARVYGVQQGDMLRVQWTQNGKTLDDVRVTMKVRDGVGKTAWSDAGWRQGKAKLKAHGPIVAKVSLKSITGQETPLRDLSFNVERMWRVDSTSPKVLHSPRYRVLPIDNLGLNWIWLRDPSPTEPRGKVYFYFWAPVDGDRNRFASPYISVTCNGQTVPTNNSSGFMHESITEVNAQDDRNVGGKRITKDRSWQLIWVKPNLVWGPKNGPANVTSRFYNISEHPGKYVVKLLSNGDVAREWNFEIGADGQFVQHPAQSTFSMRPGAYFIEATYPSSNDNQFFFDPAAVKNSVGYGRKWQNPASLSGFFSRLPAKRGNAEFPKP